MPPKKGPVTAKSKGLKTAGKAESSRKNNGPAPPSPESQAKLRQQQRLLNIFESSIGFHIDKDKLPTTLQRIKQHLFNRDFEAAFGTPEFLYAYAARWSPSRALGYYEIFSEVLDHLSATDIAHGVEALKVVSIGAGSGAELAALGNLHEHPLIQASKGRVECTVVDSAGWQAVLRDLILALGSVPALSKYASQAAIAANGPLVPDGAITLSFVQTDFLDPQRFDMCEQMKESLLVTFMFTLNELYSTSITSTTKALLDMTSALQPGSLLLVVDSPGSYSVVKLGEEEKKYPMMWLLDHTLLDTVVEGNDAREWEKLVSEDSRWFRIPQGLQYFIELQNMRYQMHLYRLKSR